MNPRALSSAASDAFHFSSGPRMDTYTFAKRRSLVPSTSVTVTNPSRGSLSSRWRTREISSLMSWFTRSRRFGCITKDLDLHVDHVPIHAGLDEVQRLGNHLVGVAPFGGHAGDGQRGALPGVLLIVLVSPLDSLTDSLSSHLHLA